ncbi:hypothetical protein BCR37DRAFT_389792 [Protomyces lactucae-debilis]|uniref:Uncharacterized protein n=1 Tax=Protomyces lactucae-debilis TaxID=2754530 RepID=A0A1Y2EU60_PROLT|nr:uncharacterized protein BCR37DRAFT_389792 [Protomyces lactucae-debilis]ORY74824.1 hypothetical protein BCR37DRAFT_389792 [Protomyces lactucae-debilis]
MFKSPQEARLSAMLRSVLILLYGFALVTSFGFDPYAFMKNSSTPCLTPTFKITLFDTLKPPTPDSCQTFCRTRLQEHIWAVKRTPEYCIHRQSRASQTPWEVVYWMPKFVSLGIFNETPIIFNGVPEAIEYYEECHCEALMTIARTYHTHPSQMPAWPLERYKWQQPTELPSAETKCSMYKMSLRLSLNAWIATPRLLWSRPANGWRFSACDSTENVRYGLPPRVVIAFNLTSLSLKDFIPKPEIACAFAFPTIYFIMNTYRDLVRRAGGRRLLASSTEELQGSTSPAQTFYSQLLKCSPLGDEELEQIRALSPQLLEELLSLIWEQMPR